MSSISPPPVPLPTPTNLVVTLCMGQSGINRIHTTYVMRGKFERSLFPSVVSKSHSPSCTNSISESGEVVVTGAKNEHEGLLNAYRLIRKLRKDLGLDVQVFNTHVQNRVYMAYLGYPINLNLFYADHQHECSYEPHNFPGVIWRLKNTGVQRTVVVTIYRTGRVVIPGLKAADACEKVRKPLEVLYKYRLGHEYRTLEEDRMRLITQESKEEEEQKTETQNQKKKPKKQKITH